MNDDRHQAMLVKLPALLRKAAALREKFGQPVRGAPIEQHRSERPRVSRADAKAAADRNHAVVLGLIAEHRKHVRVHPLEPVDDMTDADIAARRIIAAVSSHVQAVRSWHHPTRTASPVKSSRRGVGAGARYER